MQISASYTNSSRYNQVVTAMKLFGGEHAVYWTLHRACEMYQNRMQENVVVEELAALFAECATAKASPNASTRPPLFNDGNLIGSSMLTDKKNIHTFKEWKKASSDGCLCSMLAVALVLRRDENLP
jgi:hypothetical protein